MILVVAGISDRSYLFSRVCSWTSLTRHWFLKRVMQYKCLGLGPFSGEFSDPMSMIWCLTQQSLVVDGWWEKGAFIWAKSEGRMVAFLMPMRSMQQGDCNAFGDGNLWPFYSSLTCEPCYHKLLTASTGLVNGVTLYELWAWMPAVKHVHMHTQINVHIHTPTDPAPLILHFQPLGPPVEVEGLDQ